MTFSSLKIHDIVLGAKKPVAGHFRRAVSYPAPRYSEEFGHPVSLDDWAPFPVGQEDGAHLELLMGDKLGEGASASVYAATLRSPTTLDLPAHLCLKVAKRKHCQVLAREAWFYEQHYRSGACEGIITPRYFGFFILDHNLLKGPGRRKPRFKPWDEAEHHGNKPWLPKTGDSEFYRDEIGHLKHNPWNKWHQEPKDLLIVVMLVEQLGPPCNSHPNRAARRDIRDVLTDLGLTGVAHHDVRYTNVLSTLPGSSSLVCPRHQRAHAWRIIDFEHCDKVISTDEVPEDKEDCLSSRNFTVGHYFSGEFQR